MSGIYGIFHKNGAPVTSETLAPLRGALAGWGPDGQGCWTEDAVGLGHLMLHTTPESLHEHLPARHPGLADLVITADARLDNRSELCAALSVPREQWSALPDSTLILLAYERWGAACVEKLLGDFAFAIWDGRRRQLFCARDLFGNKPLLYYNDGQRFVFASDIKGVLACPQTPQKLNEALLAAYLQQLTYFAQKRYTFFEEIVKLPAAHTLTVTADTLQLTSYWSPENAPEIRLPSDAAYAEQLQALLQEAVTCRLRSAFPIGAHLSGGLDSSTVSVLAARGLRQRGERLTAFSWSPPLSQVDTTADDERNLIATICAHEQISCRYIETTVPGMLAAHQRDFTVEPTEMIWREQQVQQEAQAEQIRVILSGWGGDEVVSFDGRGYLAELFVQGQWGNLQHTIRQRIDVAGRSQPSWRKAKQFCGIFSNEVLQALAPDPLWQRITGRDRYARYPITCIEPAFARRYQEAVTALRPPALRERVGVRRIQVSALEHGHITRRLEDWTTSGAQHHLVYRYPLLDRRVLEFCLGAPSAQFFHQGWKRSLIRRAVDGILPSTVQWNPSKQEPGMFTALDLIYRQAVAAWCDDVLGKAASSPMTRYVQLTRVKEVRLWIEQHKLSVMRGVLHALACFHMQSVGHYKPSI